MRKLLTIATAAFLVLAPIAFAFGAGPVAAQSADPYSVTVEPPEDFSTDGTQTLVVRVTNNENSDFVNPLVEVPIQSPISLAANAEENVYINDDPSESVAAQVDPSTFTSGDALVITGTVIPAQETRTYHFNVTASNPSTTTISADVRPLYNTDQNVRNSTTAEILGTGTLEAAVEDVNGDPAGTGEVEIDSQARGQSVTETAIEGSHEIAVQGLGSEYPSFTVDLGIGETESATFVERSDTQQIQPIAYTEDDVSRVADSTTRNPGGPDTKINTTVSYTFAKSSGTVVYEVQPPSVPVQSDGDASVASGGTLVSSSTTAADAKQLEINDTGTTTQVDIEYEGYRLGDVSQDGAVDANDAEEIAGDLASGTSPTTVYGDVNDDGTVSPVDAMLIAQYADGTSGQPSGYTGVN